MVYAGIPKSVENQRSNYIGKAWGLICKKEEAMKRGLQVGLCQIIMSIAVNGINILTVISGHNFSSWIALMYHDDLDSQDIHLKLCFECWLLTLHCYKKDVNQRVKVSLFC